MTNVEKGVDVTKPPEQGEYFPDVEFTSEEGGTLTTRDLKGQKTVLYFYPEDDSPGCAKEACAFRNRMDDYKRADIRVYGVSLDPPESHRRFREKHNLNFPLLTDEGGAAAEALGVLRDDRSKANRVTFLLDPNGKITKVYPDVSPDTHADGILEDAEKL